MAGIIYDLIDVLAEQKECYEGLVTLATYKTEAVTNKNIDLLTQVVEREEAFIGRVQLLDGRRETLLKDIALVTGMQYETITITALIEKMGKDLEVSARLTEIREGLLQQMALLKKQNDLNKQILEHSMEYVEFTVNAIKTTRLTETRANYIKPGEESVERTRSFFDQKQ
ncbi:MAG: flagellar protein FlgN [Cellulosilyticaceae bacterium]